ncbi:MAG: hypothetical protein LGR52_11615 [Candidatus Thiosymbion ectosymbiont of Robbea hypermnestra]|nr:hypothetical protein [Candidatus Thiosymbion ectosymbiont of Robbea hypermnestra]
MKRFLTQMLSAIIAVSCMGGGNDVKLIELRRDIEQSLTVGDSYEKIERFLNDRGLLYDFDYHSSRFQAAFDVNSDTYDPDLSNVIVYIYVDNDRRFVKAEVERVYTYI